MHRRLGGCRPTPEGGCATLPMDTSAARLGVGRCSPAALGWGTAGWAVVVGGCIRSATTYNARSMRFDAITFLIGGLSAAVVLVAAEAGLTRLNPEHEESAMGPRHGESHGCCSHSVTDNEHPCPPRDEESDQERGDDASVVAAWPESPSSTLRAQRVSLATRVLTGPGHHSAHVNGDFGGVRRQPYPPSTPIAISSLATTAPQLRPHAPPHRRLT